MTDEPDVLLVGTGTLFARAERELAVSCVESGVSACEFDPGSDRWLVHTASGERPEDRASLSTELGPDGIVTPKELKDLNLGSLVGAINSGDPKAAKPFHVGSEKSLVPEKKGRLLLRMYDVDPRDNKGVLQVMFLGTFEKD